MQAYQNGIRRCMASVPLWRSSAYLEEKAGAIGKARAILEQARLKNPKQDQLWLAAIRTELRSGNNKAADALMAKALQVKSMQCISPCRDLYKSLEQPAR